MTNFDELFQVLRAVDGAEAGMGAGEAGNEDGAGEVYWPESAPEHLAELKGQNNQETIANLASKLSEQPQPPEAPDGYELSLPDDFKEKFGDLSDDQVLPIWREIAHKHGLSNEQFNGAIAELYAQVSENGLLDEPINVEEELRRLAPGVSDPVQARGQAAKRVNAAIDQVQGLVKRGILNRAEGNVVTALAASAEGVVALEKLLTLATEHGLQGGGQGGDGLDERDRRLQSLFPSMSIAASKAGGRR